MMNETNVENNQSNDSKKIITLVVLILTIMVCTTSATYAYFAFSASNSTTMTGTAAVAGLSLSVTQGTLGGTNSGTNTNVMVPQLESALGTAMGSASGKDYKCVDGNGNIVCKVFKITISTESTATVPTTGTIAFNFTAPTEKTANFSNLKWKLTDSYTALKSGETAKTANTSAVTFASPTLTASTKTFTYYIVVWINETGSSQGDLGTWTATITFNTSNGGITSTIRS